MAVSYDFLIVGCGISGAVVAHELHKKHKKVLCIDQRDHLGGNCFTKNTAGITVHVFGPHIANTNDAAIWNYWSQFTQFNNFVNRVKASYHGRLYSLPVNLMTLYQVAGCQTPADAQRYLDEVRVPCPNPQNLEDYLLSQVGPEIHEMFFKHYTEKQWRRPCKELPTTIIKRLPFRPDSYDDNYYDRRFQGIPMCGYTPIFEQLLHGIHVELGTSFQSLGNWRRWAKKMIFTGRIEELCEWSFGELSYRSLEFDHQVLDGNHQGNAIINSTDEVAHTRTVEHKHFAFQKCDQTVVTREYPVAYDRSKVPYYPVVDEANRALYQKYRQAVPEDVLLLGRLARFQYLDMDQATAQALQLAKSLD